MRSPKCTPHARSDLIVWNETLDTPEILQDFRVNEEVDDSTHHSVLSIVKFNFDYFYERRVSRPFLDYELCIDTGYCPPV